MGALEPFLVPALIAGVVGMTAGWATRRKRIRNEHWLWKKQRLRRAKILLTCGGAVTFVSAAALVV